jgi:hypothetical protein
MKLLTATLAAVAVFLTGGLVNAQQTGPDFEHLKGYGPMIGTWRYEGPLLEDVPDMAKKGSNCVFQFSWRRILDKNVVMEDWSVEFEGDKKVSGRALIGWNAAEKRLVYGAMSSFGGMAVGTVVFDRREKTSTLTSEGVDSEGESTYFKGVVTKTGKDTLTWRALQRSGGIVEGPSPEYTFKRVHRAKRRQSAR